MCRSQTLVDLDSAAKSAGYRQLFDRASLVFGAPKSTFRRLPNPKMTAEQKAQRSERYDAAFAARLARVEDDFRRLNPGFDSDLLAEFTSEKSLTFFHVSTHVFRTPCEPTRWGSMR